MRSMVGRAARAEPRSTHGSPVSRTVRNPELVRGQLSVVRCCRVAGFDREEEPLVPEITVARRLNGTSVSKMAPIASKMALAHNLPS
jgi:hypothetical protein